MTLLSLSPFLCCEPLVFGHCSRGCALAPPLCLWARCLWSAVVRYVPGHVVWLFLVQLFLVQLFHVVWLYLVQLFLQQSLAYNLLEGKWKLILLLWNICTLLEPHMSMKTSWKILFFCIPHSKMGLNKFSKKLKGKDKEKGHSTSFYFGLPW